MSDAKYTTPNQFANMLENRAAEIELIAERVRKQLTAPAIAAQIIDSATKARVAAVAIRNTFAGPNKAPEREAASNSPEDLGWPTKRREP